MFNQVGNQVFQVEAALPGGAGGPLCLTRTGRTHIDTPAWSRVTQSDDQMDGGRDEATIQLDGDQDLLVYTGAGR